MVISLFPNQSLYYIYTNHTIHIVHNLCNFGKFTFSNKLTHALKHIY